MVKFLKVIVILFLFLTGCSTTKIEEVPVEEEEVKIYDVNTATLASINRYISKNEKFKYYGVYKNDYVNAEFFDGHLDVNANNRDRPTLSIWQDETGRFLYQYIMYYDYEFSYLKNNERRDAYMTISYAFGTETYFNDNFDETIDLRANNENYLLKYENGKFVDDMEGPTKGNEVKFTASLLENLNQIYNEYTQNRIYKSDGYIVNDIVALISDNEFLSVKHDETKNNLNEESNNNSIDGNIDNLHDFEPILNRQTEPITTYSLIDDIYTIIDENGYGIIDNTGNVILVPLGDSMPKVFDNYELSIDIYKYPGINKVNQYNIESGHGLSSYIPYYDGVEVGIVILGDDGPISRSDDTKQIQEYNLLPYIEIYYSSSVGELLEGANYGTDFNYGVINGNGDVLTDAIYDNILSFGGELILGYRDNTWYYINDNGEEVMSTKEGLFSNFQIKGEYIKIPFPDINGKVIMIDENGKYGVKDIDGNTVIPFEYEDGSPFNGKILLKKNGKWLEFE